MRPLIYIMTPVLILTIVLASRFVTWDAIKGAKPQAQVNVQQGTLSLREWKIPHAIAAFTRAIEIEPKYAEAYVKRGLAYYRLGQYKAAIADYTQTLDLKRYHADAYASRGDAYRALGEMQHAIVDYSASLKKRWNARVMRRRAQTYFEQDNVQNALADYNTVIKRQPSAMAYYTRGNVYFQLSIQNDASRLKLALADMDQAIALEPRFASAYISRARIYARAGEQASATADYMNAVELLTEAIETWQGEPKALIQVYLWRAFAYQKLGEIDSGQSDLNEMNKRIFSFFLEKSKKL
ncbi:MAG: tetratricopeptide repeat protein [Candidatus Poribacteria bacterium]|nr:tetratricopeptide repeat protein [Candidatus Poribacteria bacterium]